MALCPGSINTNIPEAESHRPAELTRTDAPPSEGARGLAEYLRTGLAQGYAPSYAADMVFDAIRERRFYIFPIQGFFHKAMAMRHEDIQSGQNPRMRPR